MPKIKYVFKVEMLLNLQSIIGIEKAKNILTIIHKIFACSHSTSASGYKKINGTE